MTKLRWRDRQLTEKVTGVDTEPKFCISNQSSIREDTNCLDFQLLATLVLWELCPARAPTAVQLGDGTSDECRAKGSRSRAVTSSVQERGMRSHCSDDAV